jgi:hypothetical protein
MNKLFEIINSKEMNTALNAGLAIIIPLWIFLIIYGQDIKAWRIKQLAFQVTRDKVMGLADFIYKQLGTD